MESMMQTFIRVNGISMTSKRVAERADGLSPDFKGANHYELTIKRRGSRREMVLNFSQGSAHVGPPYLRTVLECLASDFQSLDESSDFRDWAESLGFDSDSRKAEFIYNATMRQRDDFRAVLGDAAVGELIFAAMQDSA